MADGGGAPCAGGLRWRRDGRSWCGGLRVKKEESNS
ncbi:hypothetical protein L195_g064218 [Trifolium pratense]|uniref:Uncharacterized protein n=1 Tax=Trifolium pratense TaxID=57577 RepID=A0A2K3KRP1_TRIPR|nr:hypothetical protein L195_g064218 [Trifolium pratense]